MLQRSIIVIVQGLPISIGKNLREKSLHIFPGSFVCLFVVGNPLNTDLIGSRIGEGMHGPAEVDHLPFGTGFANTVLEGLDGISGNESIVGPVTDEKSGFDPVEIIRIGRGQSAVKAYYTREIRTAVGQFKHGGAAETVADGGNPAGIDSVIISENFQPGASPPTHNRFAPEMAGQFFGLLGLFGPDAFAVHVQGECHVSKFGQFCLINTSQVRDSSGLIVFSSARHKFGERMVNGFYLVKSPYFGKREWEDEKKEPLVSTTKPEEKIEKIEPTSLVEPMDSVEDQTDTKKETPKSSDSRDAADEINEEDLND